MRATVLLVATVTVLAGLPTVAASDALQLVPEWPASFDEARREPIRLLPGPPIEDRAVHAATEPGARTAGTSHTFHWELQTPDGSPGPAGPLDLATDQPVTVDAYLSAGPPSVQAGTQVPATAEAGLAPAITVEAALTIADETHEPRRATHTLVNTPTEDDVQRYRFTFDITTERLAPGDELAVDLAVHQIDAGDDRATQPAWRIHTGAQHPTQLTLGLDRGQDANAALGLQGTDETGEDASPDTVRQGAYAALAASVLAAGWAARRGYRQLHEG